MRFLLAILLLLLVVPAQAQQGQGMSKALVVSSCGGGALPSGSVTNLTMNPQGQLCLNGISGGGGCVAATNYLARTTGGNEGGNAANITTLICGLVTDGVWANLDALYILAQQNGTDALLNLVGTNYGLGAFLIRAPVFTSYVGFTFASGFGFDTGFNAATATSPKFVQDNASMGAWAYTVVNGTGVDIGADPATDNILISYSGSFYARINGSAGGIATPGTKGLFTGDRSSSASIGQYWNGVSQATPASTSLAPVSNNFGIGNVVGNFSFASSNTLSAAFIGASLGATGQLALYNRLRTYMTAVGAP